MIRFSAVTKSYGDTPVLRGIDLTIAGGEITVLVGTSGSGKSTTLKMINRMVNRDGGMLSYRGEDIARFPAEHLRRKMGYVIQSGGLFPHWTVMQNIATVPRLLNWPEKKIANRVSELMEMLGLDEQQLGKRFPAYLSGGQQQRVGIARALAANPQILLMDEPFGALDPITRVALQDEILRIQHRDERTIVMVTHDIDEALRLADRLVIMDEGKIVQQGHPENLLRHPENDFVRRFFGPFDAGIRLLDMSAVSSRVRPGRLLPPGAPIQGDLTLREAASVFVMRKVDRLGVVDGRGRPLGTLSLSDLVEERVNE